MPKKNKRKNLQKQVLPVSDRKNHQHTRKPKVRKPSLTVELLEERAERMRQNPTPSEAMFATRLLDAAIDFRGQFVIGNYIVDFLVGSLVIEIDGAVHAKAEQRKYDARRDAFIRRMGYKILRIPNDDVFEFDLTPIYNAPPLSLKQASNLNRRQRRMLIRLGQAEPQQPEGPRLVKPSDFHFDIFPIRGNKKSDKWKTPF